MRGVVHIRISACSWRKKSAAVQAVAGAAEEGGITAKGWGVFEAGVEACEQVAVEFSGGGREMVVHPEAILMCQHEAGAAEVCEMTGDLGLGEIENADQVADAELAGAEEGEDAQAGRVGKSAEEGFRSGHRELPYIRSGKYSGEDSKEQ
jgi:hypothetical protein